jgi:hypothetical protein
VLEVLAQADAAMTAYADRPVWTVGDAELVAGLDAVHAVEQRLAAVKLALVREIDGRGLATAAGASSTRGVASGSAADRRHLRPAAGRPVPIAR